MWGHMWDYGWGWTGMGISMLLFWGLLIAAIVLLVKYAAGANTGGDGKREKSALDLLKERYARGEIDRDEFQQKKHDLES